MAFVSAKDDWQMRRIEGAGVTFIDVLAVVGNAIIIAVLLLG